ncbi:hypothetical protein Q5752_002732 [Cryptotrichosporon argae]
MSPIPLRLFLGLRYPLSVSIFSLPGQTRLTSSSSSSGSKWLVRPPSSFAPRESPTPLILVRAPALSLAGAADESDFSSWAGMFAEKGYMTVEADLSVDAPDAAVPALVNSLASQVRLLAIPFPPVLIASGLGCLVTQAYVSDHPASGIVLISPPPDEDARPAGAQQEWAWPRLTYEPKFPILVLGDKGDMSRLESSRVGSVAKHGVGRGGKGVTLEELADGPRGEKTRINIERWLDRSGF